LGALDDLLKGLSAMRLDKSLSLPQAPKQRRRAASPHSEAQLDKAISHIYDAAVESERWPAALGEILRFVGNSGTHLWLMNGDTSEVTHSIHVGMPDKMIEEYNGDVIKICPRWANARKNPDRTFLFDYQHIDESEIDSNEYYNWLQTKGDRIRYYLGGRLTVDNSVEGFQSLAFRKQEGHAQKKHLERFSRILPHVQRAIEISQRLDTWQLASQSALEVLNQLSHALVILDNVGKYLAVNRYAERLLTHPYRIALLSGRLKALDAGVDQQLQLLIGHCAVTATGKGQFQGGAVNIPADQNAAAPLRLHVCPLKLPPDTFRLGRSAVVVFLVAPTPREESDDDDLKTMFKLTTAERRLAVVLLKGTTVKEASKKLNISTNTARTQLKSVFAKVGVHRQAELIRILLPLVESRQPPLITPG
jgi:DNA-binding CsgD family transcriptional regulator